MGRISISKKQKKEPEKVKNYPDHCIFCFGKAESQQHFYTRWLRDYAGVIYDKTRHIIVNKNEDGSITEKPGKLNRRGDPYSQQLQVVCNECNTGWMSKIESNCVSGRQKLIDWKWHSITKEEQFNLGIWSVLFAMVIEFDNIESAVIPESERHFLKQNGVPNVGWHVWIGKIQDTPTTARMNRNTSYKIYRDVTDQYYGKITTFIIGDNFFIVLFVPQNFIRIAERFLVNASAHATQIWPKQGYTLQEPGLIHNNASYEMFDDLIRHNVGSR